MKNCIGCKLDKTIHEFSANGYNKGLRNTCKVCASTQFKQWRLKNKEIDKQRLKNWKIENKDLVKTYNKEWQDSHKDYNIAKRKENRHKRRIYEKEILQTNLDYKLREALRNRIRSALKRNIKTGSAVRDLGCSIAELKVYLESKFQPGMTWSNWSFKGWHLDHIKPLASFDLKDRTQFLEACHYTNLQPLWALDNLKKGAKL